MKLTLYAPKKFKLSRNVPSEPYVNARYNAGLHMSILSVVFSVLCLICLKYYTLATSLCPLGSWQIYLVWVVL